MPKKTPPTRDTAAAYDLKAPFGYFQERWRPRPKTEPGPPVAEIELRDYLGGPLLYRMTYRHGDGGPCWRLSAETAACHADYDEADAWTMDCYSINGARFYAQHHRAEMLHCTGRVQPKSATEESR